MGGRGGGGGGGDDGEGGGVCARDVALVVVWVAVVAEGPSAIGYSVSRDDGASFTAPAYIAAPGQRLSTNPVLTVDSQGVFSLAWLGFRLDFAEPDEHIYVAQLGPAADTFGTPAVASDEC